MWPFDLPAHEALRLSRQTAPAWAVFDAAWYRTTYADVVGALLDGPDDALLGYYLDMGQASGHSPNRYFDEAWHLRTYSGIKVLVDAGAFASAFDSYCRAGNKDRSPHWLFDELDYRWRHPDLTDDAFITGGLANGYDHYLRHGDREGRVGHVLFDPALYRAALPLAERQKVEQIGAFRHYLFHIEQNGQEPRTSRYFDGSWYSRRYPIVDMFESSLKHYMCNDTPAEFDPLPDFSEAWYLERDSGLRDVVARGVFRNGYAHFLRHGATELRSPAEHIDLRWYASREPVRSDLARGDAPDAFTHWLVIGRAAGLPVTPPPDERVTEGQARTLFRQRAETLAPLFGRAPLRFVAGENPTLSVVMVVGGSLATTLMTLSSLRNNLVTDIDLILIDTALSDETKSLGRYIEGAMIFRFDSDIGLASAYNAGMACARAATVLLLRDGTELAPGALTAALARLNRDPAIGATGGKVIYPHGLLANAGCIIWRDGTMHDYMRDASPLAPEANFVRDVHVCSSSILLVRRDLLADLEGFDPALPPGHLGDADLCLRIRLAGYRVVYDPAIAVWHYGNLGSTVDAKSDLTAAAAVSFRERHAPYLAACPEADGRALVFARMAQSGRRVLFIEDMIPLRTLGSGFVRSNDLICVMAALGCAVTVFPVNDSGFSLTDVYADLPDSVEVMHDHALPRLAEFLLLRRGYYDTIWVARTHNLEKIRPALEKLLACEDRPPCVVLDTEAINAVREAEKAALAGEAFDLSAAMRREFAHAGLCQSVVAVSDHEAALLRDHGLPNVSVIGHMRPLRPTGRPFGQRAGLLFVGAMHGMSSPNYDGLCWMVDTVLPLIEQSLGWETRLTIAGYTGPGVMLDQFKGHPRVSLRGAVADLEPLYASHRVFVAPTRFAAGAPYKVHEAASFGLPVVATDLLRRQLSWTAGQELLAADASDAPLFAALVVALYRDKPLWTRVRDAALTRTRHDLNPDDYQRAVGRLLGVG